MTEPCIYCRERKPCTAEHVVSAGIGGDDPDWMLTDCVCGDCNTKVFSPLENKAFRSSPIALARIFLQPHTRHRTGKSNTPIMQPRASYHNEAETGIMFEQVMRAGGEPAILPQIAIIPGGELVARIPNVEIGKTFLASLKERLSTRVLLVQKLRDGIEVRFDQTTLEWVDESARYEVTSECVSTASAPREPAIWVEEPIWPAGVDEGDFSRLPPRVFQRDGGQISCRANSISVVACLLSIFRADIDQIVIPDDTHPIAGQAHVHQQLVVDMNCYDRVFAKIGVNICAKLFGAQFVRQPEFDHVRDYIRTGEGAIMKQPVSEGDPARRSLGPQLKNHHVFMICGGPGKDADSECVIFFARLYGGPIEVFRLAEFREHQLELKARHLVVVDYISEKITSMSLEEYCLFAVQNSLVPIDDFFAER
jgi:hypothetical protein